MTQTDAPNSTTKVRRGIFGRSAAWLFSPKHFHFKLLSGTAVGIVVITFLAGLFLFVTLRNHHQETLRAHTIEVMRLGSVIENDIAALETGHRGFLLTGENSYLEPFERRRELIKHRVEDLTVLILDSPRQRKRVMKIQEIVQKWLDTVALPQMTAAASQRRFRPRRRHRQFFRFSWEMRCSIRPARSCNRCKMRNRLSSTSACRTRNGPRNRPRFSTS